MTDLSPEARALLRKARVAFSPSEGRLLAIRSAIEAERAASPGASPSSSSSASRFARRAFGAWSAAHSIGAAALIAALGAGSLTAWLMSDRSPSEARVTIETPPPTRLASAPAMEQQTAPEQLDESAPVQPEESAPQPSTPGSISTPTWQGSADLAASSKASFAPRDRARSPIRPRSRSEGALEGSGGTALAADSLAEEVRMLKDARSALDRGDAPQALRLLGAHQRRFQRGTLYEERLATRVQALCALGLVDSARLTAQELERTAPRSPHLARVRASCIAPSSK